MVKEESFMKGEVKRCEEVKRSLWEWRKVCMYCMSTGYELGLVCVYEPCRSVAKSDGDEDGNGRKIR